MRSISAPQFFERVDGANMVRSMEQTIPIFNRATPRVCAFPRTAGLCRNEKLICLLYTAGTISAPFGWSKSGCWLLQWLAVSRQAGYCMAAAGSSQKQPIVGQPNTVEVMLCPPSKLISGLVQLKHRSNY